MIIYQNFNVGKGYFIKFENSFCDSYCFTLWGAKRLAKRRLKEYKKLKGNMKRDVMVIEDKK